jgi:Tol biopolymer transport system component
MDPTIDEQRTDAAFRRFLAADADALAAVAASEYEMAARVQVRVGAARPGRRIVLLLAATLVIASLAAAAFAVAAGLIRPPRTLESQGQIVVHVVTGPLPTPGLDGKTGGNQPGEMVVVDPDTGQESSLASIVSAAAYDKISASFAESDKISAGWIPDISWTTSGSGLSWWWGSNGSDVWIADTLGVRAAATCDNMCRSELSPDGLYLALNSNFSPTVVSTTTGEEARAFPPRNTDWSPGDLTWSPDSRRLAVAAFTPTAESIFIVNRDGSGLHELVRWPPAGVVPDSQFPGHTEINSLDWSPDGTQIAYLLGSGGLTSVWNLVVQPIDGSDPIMLLENLNASGLAWSPDGREIAVVYEDTTGGSSLFVINADGTGLRRVHTNVDGQPSWRAN